MQRITFLFLTLFITITSAWAYDITGRVLDETGDPLTGATVRLLKARKDSAFVKGGVTDVNGKFRLSGINDGAYLLKVTYISYNPTDVKVSVKGRNQSLGDIKLSPEAFALKETTVTGVRTPIKVMQDTVEFNADSYKTQPNAVVEDLLKRLPGVQVSAEGKITANGKEVSKILVDGKEFFSDDPTIASRNLPVNIVDKLQVVDRKSDEARITGVDDGEEETVINLTVKKGMNNGWFGTVQGGYGSDQRYTSNFIVNRFWNGNQLTLLGGANNVNEPAFSDRGAGRFRRFGSSQGTTISRALGLNFNVGNEEIFRVGGDVMYSYTNRRAETTSERQYLFADSTSYQNSSRSSDDRGHELRANFRMQWKPDSFNTLDFQPQFSYQYNNSDFAQWSMTRAGDAQLSKVTESDNSGSSRGHYYELGGRLIYNHNFRRHRGRSISLRVNYKVSNTRERSDDYSWNKFYLLGDSIDLLDQYADNHTWNNNVNARLTWTEPLGNVKNGNYLTLSYQMQYRWSNADKLTYEHPVTWPNGWIGDPLIDPELMLRDDISNRFRNNFMTQELRAGFKHTKQSLNLEAGLGVSPSMLRSADLINSSRNIDTRWQWNLAPFARMRWKITKTRSLAFDYRSRASQPSISQLQPVADISDPLHITVGNPDLDAPFTHFANVRFMDFQPQGSRSIMAMLMGSVTQNAIVSRTSYDPTTGGSTTTYANINGDWNLQMMTMFSQPLRNRTFTINNHLMLGYANTVGFQNDQRNRSGSLNLRESLGFAWRPEKAELEIRPEYGLQYTRNSLQTSANRTVHSYGFSFNGAYYAPFGLVLNTDLRFSGTSGYASGYDAKAWMWNASVAYQFLHDRSATVTVKVNDILGQEKSISRSVTANYIDDTRYYNTLGRYVMVTLAYKFNTFGKNGTPQDRNLDGHGMRRPMGPPPGGGRGGRHGGPMPF